MVNMPKNRSFFALAITVAVFFAGAQANAAENARDTQELAAQAAHRPHIVVRPRRIEPGPDSKRYCRFWLTKEYRVSGSVIVPQQQCRWQ